MAVRLLLKGKSPIISNKIPSATMEAMVGIGEVALKAKLGKLDVDLKLDLDLGLGLKAPKSEEPASPPAPLEEPGLSAKIENGNEIPALAVKVADKLMDMADEAKLSDKIGEKLEAAKEAVAEKVKAKKNK